MLNRICTSVVSTMGVMSLSRHSTFVFHSWLKGLQFSPMSSLMEQSITHLHPVLSQLFIPGLWLARSSCHMTCSSLAIVARLNDHAHGDSSFSMHMQTCWKSMYFFLSFLLTRDSFCEVFSFSCHQGCHAVNRYVAKIMQCDGQAIKWRCFVIMSS